MASLRGPALEGEGADERVLVDCGAPAEFPRRAEPAANVVTSIDPVRALFRD
jgi:hypothetical protein